MMVKVGKVEGVIGDNDIYVQIDWVSKQDAESKEIIMIILCERVDYEPMAVINNFSVEKILDNLLSIAIENNVELSEEGLGEVLRWLAKEVDTNKLLLGVAQILSKRLNQEIAESKEKKIVDKGADEE